MTRALSSSRLLRFARALGVCLGGVAACGSSNKATGVSPGDVARLDGAARSSASPRRQAVVVSSVDTSRTAHDRLVLLVEGRPFHYRGVQVRADTMKANLGWSDEAIGEAIGRAARDGFTVANIVLFWRDVEPSRDRFDWTTLDRYIGWCEAAGIKMEIVWFGSDSTGYSFGNGANMDRVPDYAKTGFTFVTAEDGGEVVGPTHQRKLLDKTDPALLARERFVVGRMMEHVADRNERTGNRRTVVGIQLLNEANVSTVRDSASNWVRLGRSYSKPATARWQSGGHSNLETFRKEVLLSYLQGLAEEVKRSRYVIWTRHNPVGDAKPVAENERARAAGGTPLDFIGHDPYTRDTAALYRYGADPFWSQGRNFPMIMETYAGGDRIEYATLSGIAGGAAVSHYSLVESESATDSTGYPGVYGKDPVAKRAVETVDTVKHRAINELLGKVWFDVATRATQAAGRDGLVFFNPAGAAAYDETSVVGGRRIRFVTSRGGTGLAVARAANELAVGAFLGGSFSLPAGIGIVSASSGRYDRENRWVAEHDRAPVSAGGRATFEITAGEVLRIVVQ